MLSVSVIACRSLFTSSQELGLLIPRHRSTAILILHTDGIFYYSIVGYVSEADFSSDSVRGMAIQSAALSMIGLFFNIPILTSNIYIFSIVSWLA